jgi:hypothetical protein
MHRRGGGLFGLIAQFEHNKRKITVGFLPASLPPLR